MSYIYCVIGLPCSGKSHVAKLLAKTYNMQYISTGDIAREIANGDTKLWAQTKDSDLLPLEDELRKRLNQKLANCTTTCIVDGFPRSGSQVEWLADTWWQSGPEIIRVVESDIKSLWFRAKHRGRDDIDLDEASFLRRINAASKNMLEITEVAYRKMIPYHSFLTGDDKYTITAFERILIHG